MKTQIKTRPSSSPVARPGVFFGQTAGVVMAILLLAGCQKQPPIAETPAPKVEGEKITLPANAPQSAAISVEAAEPSEGAVARLTGRLIWNDDATVRIYSPVGGRVTAIMARLGQEVEPGTPLARIASPDFGQAQAEARKAVVDMQQAERTFNRVRELHEHGAASKKDFEMAEADFHRAVSEKERSLARLAIYGVDGSAVDQMFPLQSPLKGLVVEKNINPGQEVRPDQMLANTPLLTLPLFVVSDPEQLWILLDVTEMDTSPLHAGQALRIRSSAFPGKVFSGRLEVIGDMLDPNTRTVKVRGTVDNPQKLLKAEMYVTAEISPDSPAVPVRGADISLKAVFLKDNRHYLFIEQSPGQFERRAVEIGPEHNGKVSVLTGVETGQRVVTEGSLLLEALLETGGKS